MPKNLTNVISGWAFDNDGVMWGVGRNEDGDETGNFEAIYRYYSLEKQKFMVHSPLKYLVRLDLYGVKWLYEK